MKRFSVALSLAVFMLALIPITVHAQFSKEEAMSRLQQQFQQQGQSPEQARQSARQALRRTLGGDWQPDNANSQGQQEGTGQGQQGGSPTTGFGGNPLGGSKKDNSGGGDNGGASMPRPGGGGGMGLPGGGGGSDRGSGVQTFEQEAMIPTIEAAFARSITRSQRQGQESDDEADGYEVVDFNNPEPDGPFDVSLDDAEQSGDKPPLPDLPDRSFDDADEDPMHSQLYTNTAIE